MNPILALVLEYAIKYGPDVVQAVEGIVDEIKRDHPTLGDAPPADEEQGIDAAIDKVIAGMPHSDAPGGKP